jgi:hypothetical protein
MRNATILISGVLALFFLAAGLVILPYSVQDAEADASICSNSGNAIDINCDFYGPVTIHVQPTYEYPLDALPLPLPTE